MTLENKVLERIRTQRVRPLPKGVFKARDYVLWFFLGVFIAGLSLGVGMIIFMFKGADLALFEKLGLTASEKLVYSIPFFWILATGAIGGIAFINFRNTRKGYRTSGRHFLFISALIALALGSIIYALNIADYVDTAAARNIPLYTNVVPLNTNRWLDPEHGLLSGIVREKESDSDFTLRDANAELWHVTGRNISIPSGFKFPAGDRVKIIGIKTGDGEFKAIEILPWEMPRVTEDIATSTRP